MLPTRHRLPESAALQSSAVPGLSFNETPPISKRPCILCFGHDQVLLKTRRWMLERQFHVEVAENFQNVGRVAYERSIDLLILCHTLNEDECQQAIHLVRMLAPKSRILAFTKLNGRVTCAGYDERIDFLDGPHSLVSQVLKLLSPVSRSQYHRP
jgi:hypothetical protein